MPIEVKYDESTQTELEWDRQRNIVRVGNRFLTLGELFGCLGLTEEDCRIALKEMWKKYLEVRTQVWSIRDE